MTDREGSQYTECTDKADEKAQAKKDKAIADAKAKAKKDVIQDKK